MTILAWGYHTSILVEQPAPWHLGPPGEESAPYVEYGWGDRKFYKDRDRSFINTFALAFLGTQTVVYVDGWDHLPTANDGLLWRRSAHVSAEELHRLVVGLEQSFERSDNTPRPSPYPQRDATRGLFYPGRQYYIWWYDCNSWVVRRLHEAELTGTGDGVLTADDVAGRLKGRWNLDD